MEITTSQGTGFSSGAASANADTFAVKAIPGITLLTVYDGRAKILTEKRGGKNIAMKLSSSNVRARHRQFTPPMRPLAPAARALQRLQERAAKLGSPR